jgi:hypothetical protein
VSGAESAARAVLLGIALVFAAVAVSALVAPGPVLGAVGVSATDAVGVVELRAFYVGFELGAAAFLGWCGAAPARLRVGLMATVLLVGGLGAARAVGVLVDAPEGLLMPAFAALELSCAALAAALLWRLPDPAA